MKSLRLNKQMRQDILESFVEKYVSANPQPPVVDVDSLKTKFAIKLNEMLYNKYVGLVPDGMLHTKRYIQLQLPTESIVSWYFGYDEDGDYVYKPATKESKVEYVLTSTDPLWIQYSKEVEEAKQNNKAYEEWNKTLRKFKAEVTTVLESVNTTLQLVEVWPEAEPFVPQAISNPSSINLPSVNFAELNKVIS